MSDFIRKNEDEYKRVCNELGYNYNGSVKDWKSTPKEQTRKILNKKKRHLHFLILLWKSEIRFSVAYL